LTTAANFTRLIFGIQDIVRTSTVPDLITPSRFPETTFHQGHLEKNSWRQLQNTTEWSNGRLPLSVCIRSTEGMLSVSGLKTLKPVNGLSWSQNTSLGVMVHIPKLERLSEWKWWEIKRITFWELWTYAHGRISQTFECDGNPLGFLTHKLVQSIRIREVFCLSREKKSSSAVMSKSTRQSILCSSKTRFERNSVSVDGLISQAKKAFAPHLFEVEKVEWFAAYQSMGLYRFFSDECLDRGWQTLFARLIEFSLLVMHAIPTVLNLVKGCDLRSTGLMSDEYLHDGQLQSHLEDFSCLEGPRQINPARKPRIRTYCCGQISDRL